MELFLKIVAPVQSYDFQTFFHNLLLSLPASALLGLLLFFILGAFSGLKSKEQRLYIVIATTIVISFTAAFYNLGVPTETLFAVYSEWLHLIVRWVHIIVGVAWIGTSFYFNWLDSRLERDDPDFKHLDGYLWSVHSGGFYRIEKLKGPPKKLPKVLHWFKWEAYATWISGFVLLILVYYLNASSMMLGASGIILTPFQAILISIFLLIRSWLLYDYLCKNVLKDNEQTLIATGVLLFVLLSYFLTQIYGSRAAYIHVGAIIGTIMAANVFRVIIPAQRNLVSSAENKQKPNLNLSLEAKNRSVLAALRQRFWIMRFRQTQTLCRIRPQLTPGTWLAWCLNGLRPMAVLRVWLLRIRPKRICFTTLSTPAIFIAHRSLQQIEAS